MSKKHKIEVQVNGPEECFIHTLRKSLGNAFVERLYPDAGACDEHDRDSTDYMEMAIANAGDPDFDKEQSIEKPGVTNYATPIGQTIHKTCGNHAKLVEDDARNNDRFFGFSGRPLNPNEAPDLERRQFERNFRDTNKFETAKNRIINRLQQRRIDIGLGILPSSVSIDDNTPLAEALPPTGTPTERPQIKVYVDNLPAAPTPASTTPDIDIMSLPDQPPKINIPSIRRPWDKPTVEPTGE